MLSARIGVVLTFACWWILAGVQRTLPLPEFHLSDGWRWGGGAVFLSDAIFTLLWSHTVLVAAQEKNVLATTGPFAYLRHPIYGAILWSGTAAVAFMTSSWMVLLGAAPLSILWTMIAQSEEGDLRERFGEEFEAYAARTGQLFPSLSRFTETAAKNNHNSHD